MSHFIYYYAECHFAECRYAECCYAECRYAECRYAECRYAECRDAECRGAVRRLPLEWGTVSVGKHSRLQYNCNILLITRLRGFIGTLSITTFSI